MTEDNTDASDEPLFNTNTLPICGMGQTTRLLLLKLAEVFNFSNTQWVNLFKVHRKTQAHSKKNSNFTSLDLDAEREDDMDIDTTEQVLGFE